MIGKTLTYLNFDGEEVTETSYFNLSRGELTKMDAVLPGGFEQFANSVIARRNTNELIKFMDMLIMSSYGIKTMEGRFIKPKEMQEAFMCSEAYSSLLEDLLSSDKKVEEFIAGIMPKVPEDHKKPQNKLPATASETEIPSFTVVEKVETEEERIERLIKERLKKEREAVSVASDPSV